MVRSQVPLLLYTNQIRFIFVADDVRSGKAVKNPSSYGAHYFKASLCTFTEVVTRRGKAATWCNEPKYTSYSGRRCACYAGILPSVHLSPFCDA